MILKVIGHIQTTIILSFLYFIGFGLTALFVRLLGADLLGKRKRKASYWIKRNDFRQMEERYRQQF